MIRIRTLQRLTRGGAVIQKSRMHGLTGSLAAQEPGRLVGCPGTRAGPRRPVSEHHDGRPLRIPPESADQSLHPLQQGRAKAGIAPDHGCEPDVDRPGPRGSKELAGQHLFRIVTFSQKNRDDHNARAGDQFRDLPESRLSLVIAGQHLLKHVELLEPTGDRLQGVRSSSTAAAMSRQN